MLRFIDNNNCLVSLFSWTRDHKVRIEGNLINLTMCWKVCNTSPAACQCDSPSTHSHCPYSIGQHCASVCVCVSFICMQTSQRQRRRRPRNVECYLSWNAAGRWGSDNGATHTAPVHTHTYRQTQRHTHTASNTPSKVCCITVAFLTIFSSSLVYCLHTQLSWVCVSVTLWRALRQLLLALRPIGISIGILTYLSHSLTLSVSVSSLSFSACVCVYILESCAQALPKLFYKLLPQQQTHSDNASREWEWEWEWERQRGDRIDVSWTVGQTQHWALFSCFLAKDSGGVGRGRRVSWCHW